MGQNWEEDYVEYPEQCPVCWGDTLDQRTQDWCVPAYPGFCCIDHANEYLKAQEFSNAVESDALNRALKADELLILAYNEGCSTCEKSRKMCRHED